jgi:hypothetical protein
MNDDEIERFLDKVFGPDDENPCVNRGQGCRKTDSILDYIHFEWQVDVIKLPHHVQDKVMDMIEELKGKDCVSNIASKIAIELLQL